MHAVACAADVEFGMILMGDKRCRCLAKGIVLGVVKQRSLTGTDTRSGTTGAPLKPGIRCAQNPAVAIPAPVTFTQQDISYTRLSDEDAKHDGL